MIVAEVEVTEPQERALRVLLDNDEHGITAGNVGRALWPDSPAWRRMTSGWNGYPGKTMPAKAGALLWRLERLGLAWCTFPENSRKEAPVWRLTGKARRALT